MSANKNSVENQTEILYGANEGDRTLYLRNHNPSL